MKENKYCIVAIGASAGGLEAIQEFFDHLPESPGIAIVIIQHLSPDYKSLLVELVARHSPIPVYEAGHDVLVEVNCVYVIPNNKFITIKRSRLLLIDKIPSQVPNNAIDVFFHALARDHRSQAVAIVLSGTGTDGSRGIVSIRRGHGMVIVQVPESAKFDGMPRSAIGTGEFDVLMRPSEMPSFILDRAREARKQPDEVIDSVQLDHILERVSKASGHEFQYYKTPTITRRIIYRMKKLGLHNLKEYTAQLNTDEEECKALAREFLINVTRFFRDAEAFAALTEKVFPAIMSGKNEGEPVKIWVCACSTGEEAYSIAILLDQFLMANGMHGVERRIFATDIDKENIAFASKGIYAHQIREQMTEEVLKKYFIEQKDGFAIIPRIRKQIVFAQHNVVKDPPLIRNDLVSCRNMLIYMSPALQEKAYLILLYATLRNGFLFLGTTETASSIRNFVEEIDQRWKLFQKKSEATLSGYIPDGSISRRVSEGRKRIAVNGDYSDDLLGHGVARAMIDGFGIVTFFIDRQFNIHRTIGSYEKILSVPRKDLRLNLIRMLPDDIASLVAGEIRGSWKSRSARRVKQVAFVKDGEPVALEVLIIPEIETQNQYTLVACQSLELTRAVALEPRKLPDNQYLTTLEEELQETRAHLQHAIEDLETANEELQSSNEELLSANEELQSSNEELQSLNEELHTLNTEHQLKIRELIELNDDLNNYFRSSEIGQVFLDKNLSIRKFNPASVRMVNLIDGDIGRPITHISTNIAYEGFLNDIQRALDEQSISEREVRLKNGLNLLMRIMPYLAGEKKVSGVIITFVDVTSITNLNNIIRGIFNASTSGILALSAERDASRKILDFSIVTANQAAEGMFSSRAPVLEGAWVRRDLQSAVLNDLFERFASVADRDETVHSDIFDKDSRCWYQVVAVKMMDGLVATFSDITQKRQGEDRLKRNYVELVTVKENLRRLNDQLERKVEERTRELSGSEERFRMVSRATNDAIWDWDLVQNSIWYSDIFYERFGFEAKQKFDRAMWLSHVHPDDVARVRSSISSVLDDDGRQWVQEYRFRKQDGTYAVILDRGYVLHNEQQVPYRMLGSMLDLSALRRAELQLRRNEQQQRFLADSMPLMVVLGDGDGSVRYLNQYCFTYTGIGSKPQDFRFHDIINTIDYPYFERQWIGSIQDGYDFQTEVRVRTKEGGYRWNVAKVIPTRNEQNEIAGWILTLFDIDEQKKINEVLEEKVQERTRELLEMNQNLENSNNDLQQFASVASHDLQEPLRKIHLFANLLQERFANNHDDTHAYLLKILSSSSRMKSIISNILNYSRLSADTMGFEATDLNVMIGEIIDDLEIAIQEKNAIIDVGHFPLIEVVPGQMRQVFQNLLGNALKFAKKDIQPQIIIRAEVVRDKRFESKAQPDGAYCRITVRDNGIGFNEKFAHHIFVLFQRLHSKDAYEGTGIGLAIAKKIIEKHHGIISATSIENEGACFTIVLPLKQGVWSV